MTVSNILIELKLPYWRNEPISSEKALEKMFKHTEKAIAEHQIKEKNYPLNRRIVLPVPHPDSCPLPTTLKYISTAYATPGSKLTMKNAHFAKELPRGYLAGVFDGHSGAEAATIARDHCSNLFEEHFSTSGQNAHYALEKTFEALHQRITESCSEGTTAVVCYIENRTNRIYTATLGDSEAHIYRLFHDRMQALPASRVRNSTSLGNREHQTVIHKPKITVHQLLPGDVVNLATNVLKRCVSEKITAQKVHMLKLDPEFTELYSRVIVEDAIHLQSTENITAVTIQINEA